MLQKVAVIGSGIAGLSAAWLLSRSKHVTLYEADDRFGGHAHTRNVEVDGTAIPVDTGFIVYNEPSYPNLTAFFRHLSVPTIATDMSFAVSTDGGRFEYSGAGWRGLIAQRRNIANPRLWRIVRDVLRFYREVTAYADGHPDSPLSLGDYLAAQSYSRAFVEDHIIPMGAAIWSTPAAEMMAFPLVSFVRFCRNHALLQIKDRPRWRTLPQGSRDYVNRIIATLAENARAGLPVRKVIRQERGVAVLTDRGGALYDDVVIATHADSALSLLASPTQLERRLLSAFHYSQNHAVLHQDAGLMPRTRRAWAAWNYLKSDDGELSVTYWMNRLQSIAALPPTFVTLNPKHEVRNVLYETTYAHPMFDAAAMAAQKELWRLQGVGGVWYCGAHFGYGFHEDGIQSGLAVAEALGGLRRPWDVADESGRIHLNPEGRMRALDAYADAAA